MLAERLKAKTEYSQDLVRDFKFFANTILLSVWRVFRVAHRLRRMTTSSIKSPKIKQKEKYGLKP